MGRIKTTLIKRVTHELMRLHFNEFTDDFNKNKGIVNKFVSISSKKLRNAIAGYATRLIKKSKESKDTILNQLFSQLRSKGFNTWLDRLTFLKIGHPTNNQKGVYIG